MSDGGNSLFVVDRELGHKWHIAYWSEHTVEEVLRRLRPGQGDAYELVHDELGTIREDVILMDLPLRRGAILSLRQRRSGDTGTLVPMTLRLAYTATTHQEVTGDRAYNVAAGLTIEGFLDKILPDLPDPGRRDFVYLELDGQVLPATMSLSEILAKDGAQPTLRNRLLFQARYGDQVRPFKAHPSFAVGKLLDDMRSGKMGDSFKGRSLAFYLDGKELPTDQTLAQCGVRNGAVLDLSTPGTFPGAVRENVQFLLVGDIVGRPEKSIQRGSATVMAFVRELAVKYKRPPDQLRLVLNGVVLAGDAKLGGVLQDGAEVRLEVVAPRKARVATPALIQFELLDTVVGRPRPVNVPGTATVRELLATMSSRLGLAIEELAIEFDGVRLDTKAALGSVLTNGDKARLVVIAGAGAAGEVSSQTATPPPKTPPAPAPGPLPAKLAFELFDSIVSKPRPVDVPGSLLVRDLLQTMADKHKRPVGDLFLELGGARLPNDAPIGSLVKNGEKVLLGVGLPAASECRLSLPDGRAITISGAPDESLDAALQRAAAAHGVRGRLAVFLNGNALPGNAPAAHLPAYASNPAIRLELRIQA